MQIFDADDPLVLNGTYDIEGYKPGERERIAKAKGREAHMERRRRPKTTLTPAQAETVHAIHTGAPDPVAAAARSLAALNLQQLPLDLLRPSPRNARRRIDLDRLQELAESIRVHGVLEPLLVRPLDGTETFEIVAGERRYRAALLAERESVPVLVRPLTDEETLEFALIENLQRADLDPLEQARGFQALMAANPAKYSPRTIADRLGLSAQWVFDRLALLHLVPAAQALLEDGTLTASHALLLARLKATDQDRALEGGVFEAEGPTLDLDPVDRRKPVSVRELDAWIARHVRFDPTHAAVVAPLDFGPTGEALDRAHAAALDVVALSYDETVSADVRGDGAPRIYGAGAWKQADGRGHSKVCEAAVLGVFTIGPAYGQTLTVCVDPACDTHWKKERLARQRETKERADRREEQAERTTKTKAAAEKADTARSQWRAAIPALVDAMQAAVRTAPFKRVLAVLQREYPGVKFPATADGALRVLAATYLRGDINGPDAHATGPALLKPLGVNTTAVIRAATKGRA